MPRRVEVSSATFQLGHHHHKVNKQTKHFLMSSSDFALQKMTSYKIHPSVVIYR
jgi:hypothetical protein